MMSAKPLVKCPACGKKKLRRLIGTGAGVIFKGGGFYETDYRSESYQKDAKADKPPEATDKKKAGDAKSADGKSGDKPAAKAETSSKKAEPKPKKSDTD
jgi:predicted nucleic acid-binding Zn ribbon protein